MTATRPSRQRFFRFRARSTRTIRSRTPSTAAPSCYWASGSEVTWLRPSLRELRDVGCLYYCIHRRQTPRATGATPRGSPTAGLAVRPGEGAGGEAVAETPPETRDSARGETREGNESWRRTLRHAGYPAAVCGRMGMRRYHRETNILAWLHTAWGVGGGGPRDA